MARRFTKQLTGAIVASFLLSSVACGTIFYPERRGRTSGVVDTKIAIFDGIGLIFFLIPGIIAYIVDFNTGAIYLPSGISSGTPQDVGPTVVKVDRALLQSPAAVEELVSQQMGLSSATDWSKLEASRITADQVEARLQEAQALSYTY